MKVGFGKYYRFARDSVPIYCEAGGFIAASRASASIAQTDGRVAREGWCGAREVLGGQNREGNATPCFGSIRASLDDTASEQPIAVVKRGRLSRCNRG